MKKYLQPNYFRKRHRFIVRELKQEEIDGVPKLVLYFEGEERGLILTRQLAEDATRILGRNSLVERFFGMH